MEKEERKKETKRRIEDPEKRRSDRTGKDDCAGHAEEEGNQEIFKWLLERA